ncbi:MAG: preprotein translocase subunit SecG [Lachnospiraceae bacterium]|jgi:preprotein translocase subunit SecG|nr:preprotein translocase subunit SecG [Lachnospiraceae bacterium]MBQ2106715.1 preprotein translocase subunit SecG [Lachnospiraceae bacterium]MBQ2250044.1 preprotein translocase subunit SecG [Lachnospiraceae bacterium]MBQ2401008.1 preprotein translocase subunit SecG [Lachnospiraceae bacterium]MBQ2426015.1 preprotein translocase subunit SecG [Lachnospiraceae bacterium]
MLRILLTIVFVIACVAMTVIVLMQEGKSSGLGALSGAAESHWAKNKGRTLEGNMEKITKIIAVLIFVLALALNLNI